MKEKTKPLISDEELDRQMAAAVKFGEENPRIEPRVLSVSVAGHRLTVELETGWSFSFDPRMLPEIKNSSAEDAVTVKLLGAGYTLEWTALDEHLGIGTIIAHLLGESFLKSISARRSGKTKSARKAAASAANGKLGGRPAGKKIAGK